MTAAYADHEQQRAVRAHSPIPVSDFLIETYKNEPDNITAAYFTLPFGLRSLAYLYKTNKGQPQKRTFSPPARHSRMI